MLRLFSSGQGADLWTHYGGSWLLSSPLIGDRDGDHVEDVLVISDSGLQLISGRKGLTGANLEQGLDGDPITRYPLTPFERFEPVIVPLPPGMPGGTGRATSVPELGVLCATVDGLMVLLRLP